MTTKTTQPITHTLDAPGATLTYDLRRNDESEKPALFLIGSPMGAAGFDTLAGHFSDRTVVTYDPRGSERSEKDDPASPVDPDIHADDLCRVIEAVENLNDLRIPPGNRLEKLKGNRKGQHSIRINQQWRICFRWTDAGAEDVEIVDYH